MDTFPIADTYAPIQQPQQPHHHNVNHRQRHRQQVVGHSGTNIGRQLSLANETPTLMIGAPISTATATGADLQMPTTASAIAYRSHPRASSAPQRRSSHLQVQPSGRPLKSGTGAGAGSGAGRDPGASTLLQSSSSEPSVRRLSNPNGSAQRQKQQQLQPRRGLQHQSIGIIHQQQVDRNPFDLAHLKSSASTTTTSLSSTCCLTGASTTTSSAAHTSSGRKITTTQQNNGAAAPNHPIVDGLNGDNHISTNRNNNNNNDSSTAKTNVAVDSRQQPAFDNQRIANPHPKSTTTPVKKNQDRMVGHYNYHNNDKTYVNRFVNNNNQFDSSPSRVPSAFAASTPGTSYHGDGALDAAAIAVSSS